MRSLMIDNARRRENATKTDAMGDKLEAKMLFEKPNPHHPLLNQNESSSVAGLFGAAEFRRFSTGAVKNSGPGGLTKNLPSHANKIADACGVDRPRVFWTRGHMIRPLICLVTAVGCRRITCL